MNIKKLIKFIFKIADCYIGEGVKKYSTNNGIAQGEL